MPIYWPDLNTPARALFQQAAFACASEKPTECLQLLRAAYSQAVSDLGESHVSTLNISGYLSGQLRHQVYSEEDASLAHRTLTTART
jgi:hypothetical protein